MIQQVCSPLLVGSLQLPEEECSVVSSALSLRVNRAKNVLRSTFGCVAWLLMWLTDSLFIGRVQSPLM